MARVQRTGFAYPLTHEVRDDRPMVLDGATLFHVNVNCSRLDESVTFYRDGLGLSAAVRTTPEGVQEGAAFGLDRAQWDAWILTSDLGFAGAAIDLLEWIEPRPVAHRAPGIVAPGWCRVGLMVPNADAARESAIRHGGTAWSAPFSSDAADGAPSMRLCFVTDPDGFAIELIEAGIGPRVAFVGLTCADIDASVSFYESLGFRVALRVDAGRDTGDHLAIDGPVAMQEVLMAAPSGDVGVLLAGFSEPASPAAARGPANGLGAWRVAFTVDDIDAACVALRALNVEFVSDVTEMAMGPGLPSIRFVCFRGPDHEVIELIERPGS